jgi:hypothetical protein
LARKGNIDADPPKKHLFKEGDKVEGEIVTEDGIKYDLKKIGRSCS